MKKASVLAAAIAAILSCALPASADVLYSNFGPGDSFVSDQGWFAGESAPDNVQTASAMPAITGGNFYLESITAAVSHDSGDNVATIVVWDDDNGKPGSVIEEAAGGGFGSFPTNDQATKFGFSGTNILLENEIYWIGFKSDTGSILWNWVDDGNNPGTFIPHVFKLNDGPWGIQGDAPAPAFRVEGSPVPTPGALTLLSGLSILVKRRRRG